MSITAFLTDSTLCIGCKACEVACKEWNGLEEDGLNWSGHSYDNTGAVGASTWRHVKFVEQAPTPGLGGNAGEASWTFSSDVCKHCEEAGCLEACPTGSIVRTEFGGVFIQPDVCNGCGYCVTSCPFGVVERNPKDGRAFKCTFCYDRQKVGLEPACAKACPTESIKFGEIEALRAHADSRIEELHRRGIEDANLYNASDTSVGGTHAMFIVRGDPRSYNLPSAPEVPTVYQRKAWTSSAIAAALLFCGTLIAFAAEGRHNHRLKS
ncbi:MAG TPA: 4Fe-4S dicluster domain-containing protein [Candidatus Sulfotelmatobacter sp.]|jgi:formate dehydrogenase iron-sulfur subunit